MTDKYRLFYKLSRNPAFRPMLTVARKLAWYPTQLLLSLYMGKVTYFMMGTVTNKNCDFQKDPEFQEAYKSAMKQQYMPDTDIWRYHINHWAMCHALKLSGDFVECGVNKGSTAMSNIVYTNFGAIKDKKYYLFDTYNGLDPVISTQDEYDRLKGHYPDCYQFVVDSFAKFPNVVVIKGSVPDTLFKARIEKVAYLSLDMNCAFAEEQALIYFWDKIVPRGIVVLDDYGWAMCEGQKAVADNFAQSVSTKIMYLPNGQGIIIK